MTPLSALPPRLLSLAACCLIGWSAVPASATSSVAVELDADYPGGNIRLVSVDEMGERKARRVHLAPDLRHMQEGRFWFYWSFRTKDREGFTATFSHRDCLGTRGPAVSYDEGRTWAYLGREAVSLEEGEPRRWSFEVAAAPEGGEVRYAFAPQYQQSHFEAWRRRHASHPDLTLSEHAKSRAGRSVERIDIARGAGGEGRRAIVLTARHHSCETMGSYVLEGFLDAALADDETGRSLRERHRIVALPFMDKDGVEDGDQGKNRAPHDHNRDYNERPLYPEVAALMAWGERHASEVAAFLDLHCPAVHGIWDNRVYFVGAPEAEVEQRQARFVQRLRETMRGGIPVREDDLLRFGQAWNQGANYSQGRHSAGWARDAFPGAALVTTLETPYASARQTEVNAGTARQLGADLARAVERHLAAEEGSGLGGNVSGGEAGRIKAR